MAYFDVLMWLFALEFWLFEGLRLIWIITINFLYCMRLSTFDAHSSLSLKNAPCILMHLQKCQRYIINTSNYKRR